MCKATLENVSLIVYRNQQSLIDMSQSRKSISLIDNHSGVKYLINNSKAYKAFEICVPFGMGRSYNLPMFCLFI